MKRFKLIVPLLISRNYQNITVIHNLITYLQLITDRIKTNKEKYLDSKNIIHELTHTIALDIKSLYLFAKIYFDYFIQYITLTFLPKNIGIKSNSFNDHVKSLRIIKFEEFWFNEYKEFIFKYARKIKFRIRYIRDNMITHRKLNVNEFWGFDEQNKRFFIYFEKSVNVQNALKNKIIDLNKKYGIELFHNKKVYSGLVYLDLILTKLETMDKLMDLEDEKLIEDYRIQLGVIVNEENIIQLINEFSEGVSIIIKKKFPNIIIDYISRF